MTDDDINKAEQSIIAMCRSSKRGIENLCWKANTGSSYTEKACGRALINATPQAMVAKPGYSLDVAIMGALGGDRCGPRSR